VLHANARLARANLLKAGELKPKKRVRGARRAPAKLAQANLLIPKECFHSRVKLPQEPADMVKPTLRTKSIGFKVRDGVRATGRGGAVAAERFC
jgi:hypothetical protein